MYNTIYVAGALYLSDSQVTIINSIMTQNSCVGSGSAIYAGGLTKDIVKIHQSYVFYKLF